MISYGIAWLWLQGDLPGLMTAAPVRCAGDRAADDLRHARTRCERLLERVEERHGKVMNQARRSDPGHLCESIVETMAVRGCEATTAEQARRWSREILEDIDEAETEESRDPDEIHSPEPEIRDHLRQFATVLLSYGAALGELEQIERRNYDREKEPALRSSSEEGGGR